MTVVSNKPPITPPPNNPRKERASDGAWIDAKGIQGTHARLETLTPATPKKPSSDVVAVYINGMGTFAEQHVVDLQEVADATGHPVIGLHMSTQSVRDDVWTAIRLKMGLGLKEPSVRALAEYINVQLESRKEVVLFAYSRGSLVIEWALKNIVKSMREQGMTDVQIERKLKAISVETYGGVASDFPSGPRYKHYINCQDALPKLIGPGATTIGKWITRARTLGMDTFERGVGNDAQIRQLDIGTRSTRKDEYLSGHSLGVYLGYRSKDQE